jgi:hypothetical protein
MGARMARHSRILIHAKLAISVFENYVAGMVVDQRLALRRGSAAFSIIWHGAPTLLPVSTAGASKMSSRFL